MMSYELMTIKLYFRSFHRAKICPKHKYIARIGILMFRPAFAKENFNCTVLERNLLNSTVWRLYDLWQKQVWVCELGSCSLALLVWPYTKCIFCQSVRAKNKMKQMYEYGGRHNLELLFNKTRLTSSQRQTRRIMFIASGHCIILRNTFAFEA